jgi:hypothetical protein
MGVGILLPLGSPGVLQGAFASGAGFMGDEHIHVT